MLLPHWTPRQVTDFRKQGWGAAGAQGRRPAARARFRGPAQLRRRSEEPGLQPSPRAVARLGTGAKGPGRRRPPAWVGAGALPTGTHTTPERKQQFTGREGRDLHKTSANRGRGEKAMAPRTTRPLQRRTPVATAVERQSGRRLRQEHGPPHRQSLARRAARDGHWRCRRRGAKPCGRGNTRTTDGGCSQPASSLGSDTPPGLERSKRGH